MKKTYLNALGVMMIAMITSCNSCKDENTTETPTTGTVKVEFEHTVNTLPFGLNADYITTSGDTIQYTTAKYYVSNVGFVRTDGTVWKAPNSYYLIDLTNEESALLSVTKVPNGDYTAVQFTIGVDSLHNVSGSQTGALSVSNGLFWSWNSGYIFAKMEGTYHHGSSGNFAYHLGGFTGTSSCIREQEFDLGGAVMTVSPDATPQIHMNVDMMSLFEFSTPPLDVMNVNNVTMPGSMASSIMDNFVGGIEFEHLHN